MKSVLAFAEGPLLKADEIPTSAVVIALTILVAAIVFLVMKTKKK